MKVNCLYAGYTEIKDTNICLHLNYLLKMIYNKFNTLNQKDQPVVEASNQFNDNFLDFHNGSSRSYL